MLTKKNLWFLTLFSIIIVMTIYYITIPTEEIVSKEEVGESSSIEVQTLNFIDSLKIDREEELEREVSGIKDILMDTDNTTEEKSDAYEALKELNLNKGKEETLENTIKENFNYDSFVKIDGTNVKVVIDSNQHSYDLANKIISEVQKSYDEKMYITVTFGSV